MWIIGGDANQGNYQNDVWNSADGKSWRLVNNAVPWAPRALHYTLVFKNRIWVMGGQTMPGFARSREVFYRDVWTTEDGIAWKRIKPKKPSWSARGMIGSSVVFRGRMWIQACPTPKMPQ